MKMNKLVMACSALFAAGMGTQALAVDLYVSGASALQISFQKAVADLCNPGLPRAFFTNANGQSYQCTSEASVFGGVAKPLNIWKRNAGGSGFGVFPVANSSAPAPYNVVTYTSQTGCTVSGTVTIGGVPGWVNNINCPNTLVHRQPDAGLSDVEPALFGYKNGGPNQLAAAAPIFAQVFGVPVNDKLYRKLQALQGIPPEPVGVFNPDKAPSLTYAQVRTLFNGTGIQDWSVVHTGITHAGNGNIGAKVCRRTGTSGTQAVFNALFENNPCGGIEGSRLVTADNNGDNNTVNDGPDTGSTITNDSVTLANKAAFFAPTAIDGYTVVMNSGNAQVDACLTKADVDGELAIGFLGTERVSGATPSDDADGFPDQWHYVKLSGGKQSTLVTLGQPAGAGLGHPLAGASQYQAGAYPSVDNTMASTYDVYAEATFNRRPGGYTPDVNTLLGLFPALMGNPATIVSNNLIGIAAIAANGYDPTLPAHYPTMKGSRNGNTCAPTLLYYPNSP